MAEQVKKTIVKAPDNFKPEGDKPIFQWESPEFVRYKKSAKWFIAIISLGIILGFILYKQGQWSGTLLVAVALLVFTTLSHAKPRKIKCAVYQNGIVVENKVYGFNAFKSFWVVYGDLPKARLQMAGRFAGQVTMPLAGVDPEQIRLLLGKHMPEEDKGEDITEIINHFMRF